MREISPEMLKISILDICLNITNLKLQLHLPSANELMKQLSTCCVYVSNYRYEKFIYNMW